MKKGGQASMVGPNAGVTRALQTRIRISEEPPIYLYDTPGIMDPHVKDPMQAIKIALTGGTKDRLVDDVHVADYLLFELNKRGNTEYVYFLTEANLRGIESFLALTNLFTMFRQY